MRAEPVLLLWRHGGNDVNAVIASVKIFNEKPHTLVVYPELKSANKARREALPAAKRLPKDHPDQEQATGF